MKVMRTFITLSVVALILPLSAGVIAAVWLGRYDNTPTVTTLVRLPYQRGVQAQMMTQFIDLRRLYTLSQPLNKDYRVIDAQLWGAFHAYVIAEHDDTTLELRFVDLRRDGDPGTLIAAVESSSVGVEVGRFSPSWSPDQSRVAFYNFVEEQSYIYDLETGQHHAIPGQFVDTPFFLNRYWWSPDGRQIAIVEEPQTLFIVNADGENVRRLSLTDVARFRPNWSADSQRILIGYQNLIPGTNAIAENAPIRLLDVNTMQLDATLAEYQGDVPTWCDERWIGFTHHLPDRGRVPYVLDTQTGELYNLGENPVLADYTAGGLSFNQTCEYVFILATQTAPNLSRQSFRLVSDIYGNDMRELAEASPMFWQNERILTYMVQEDDDSHIVYRANLDDLEHPEVVVKFKPPYRLVYLFTVPLWIENSDTFVVNFPDALYRLDGRGLLPVTGREVVVLQYQSWPEDE